MLVLLGQRTAGLGQQQADLQLVGQQRGSALGRIGRPITRQRPALW
jgi:hypothetical protein